MKKKATRKLQLKTESIRTLTRQLDKVRGGRMVFLASTIPPTGYHCPTC